MTLKGDVIFKEKFTGGLKNDTRILVNFQSKNLHFYGLIFSKAYKILDEKVQKS